MTIHLTKDASRYDTRYFLTTEIYVERDMNGDQPTDFWKVYRRADIFDNDYHERKKSGVLLRTVDTAQLLAFIAHKALWETIMHNTETIEKA